jgi:hypothetical protein
VCLELDIDICAKFSRMGIEIRAYNVHRAKFERISIMDILEYPRSANA